MTQACGSEPPGVAGYAAGAGCEAAFVDLRRIKSSYRTAAHLPADARLAKNPRSPDASFQSVKVVL